LIHLRHELPEMQLAGADLSMSTIETNKQSPDLAGVAFDVMDVVKGVTGTYDVITCNAIFFSLDDAELASALASIRRALNPGGQLFAFDWFHPHDDQHLTIIERSREFAHGLRITARPENQMRAAMLAAGFTSAEFRPFYMPIDLPRPRDANDVTSYTVLADAQRRLSFRGALYQPWSHMRGVA
jgi:SAM-dependent methyltransferase